VDVVAVYETVAADSGQALRGHFERREIDAALFTSSSTVNAVVGALGPRAAEILASVTVASIGPITSKTLAERGIRVDSEATTFTVDGLLDALERHFSAL
jgi:uroporphyrinogen-III synthase